MIKKLKVLFVAQFVLKKELGGPKAVIELAEGVQDIGHETTVVGPIEIESFLEENRISRSNSYATNINKYLTKVAGEFDVVDVDASVLYEYKNKNSNTLIVVRCALFTPHLQHIKWPVKLNFKNKLGEIKRRILHGDMRKKSIARYYKSLEVADLIFVNNHKDKERLLFDKFSEDKIANLPLGLPETKRQKFRDFSKRAREGNNLVFLGTFDFRKGCLDIPKIFSKVKEEIPDAKLFLLGSKGLFRNSKKIYSFFPFYLHPDIIIIPEFKEHDLPNLLQEIKVALFPSYLEGFGFSVIETMAAGIPVIAYDAPGPSSILSNEYLVPAGDWNMMADKLIYYLNEQKAWENAHEENLEKSNIYNWKSIAEETVKLYLRAIDLNSKSKRKVTASI